MGILERQGILRRRQALVGRGQSLVQPLGDVPVSCRSNSLVDQQVGDLVGNVAHHVRCVALPKRDRDHGHAQFGMCLAADPLAPCEHHRRVQVMLCIVDVDVYRFGHRGAQFGVDLLQAGLGRVQRCLAKSWVTVSFEPVDCDGFVRKFQPLEAIVCVLELPGLGRQAAALRVIDLPPEGDHGKWR